MKTLDRQGQSKGNEIERERERDQNEHFWPEICG